MKKMFTIVSSKNISLKIGLAILAVLVLLCPIITLSSHTYASAKNVYWAKVQSEGVYFFENPSESQEERLFEIPVSFFVKLIDEEDENFFKANYLDLEGYVKKSDVTAMNGTPQKPYLSATFRVYARDGLELCIAPSSSSYNISMVPYLTRDIIYYGKISGEELVPESSNIWYYCKVAPSQKGYLYSVYCDKLNLSQENTEVFPIIDNIDFSSPAESLPISSVGMAFIIIGVSIPCLVVIYLLIKPTIFKEKSEEKVKIPRKKRHGDYYEFDESDLN